MDRTKAAQYGAGLSDVGAAVQMVTNGIKVGEYRPLNIDREVDIRVRFPKSERNIDQLENLNVNEKDDVPSKIDSKWLPNEDFYDVLTLTDIPKDFADATIAEFILYWKETATFMSNISRFCFLKIGRASCRERV